MKKFLLIMGVLCTVHHLHSAISTRYDHVYCVVLAGGDGTRLWPLSRKNKPKQLLAVGSEKSLLEQAIDRAAAMVPQERIWISTVKHHQDAITDMVGDKVGRIVVEPGSRNTGPAILLCCLQIQQEDPDAVIVFAPADPYIPDTQKFVQFLENAIDFSSKHNSITLLGVTPTYAATGFGYIEFSPQSSDFPPYHVKHFREKPSEEVAQQYVEAGNMLWNIGMFCAKVELFIEEFKRHAPEMFYGVQAYVQGRASYDDVLADSIDYAVMEKTDRVAVLPVNFSWCDVGNIEVFLSINEAAQQAKAVTRSRKISDQSRIISVDAHSNLVDVPSKLVALVGVHDLCVVDTGDALLITKRNQAERVRAVVAQLKQQQLQEYV